MDIKINLSKKEIEALINKTKDLKKSLSKLDEKIVDKLADQALEDIQKNFQATPFKEGNDDTGFFKVGSAKQKSVGMVGSQVLYNEFGTGTKGMIDSHPEKNKFGLKGYNTGKTIRRNTRANSRATEEGIAQGELYWTYKENGEKIYTTGIPAGMQVYNAAQSLKKKKEKIIKEEVGDLLSKL